MPSNKSHIDQCAAVFSPLFFKNFFGQRMIRVVEALDLYVLKAIFIISYFN